MSVVYADEIKNFDEVQFAPHVLVTYNQDVTPSIRSSHNVSSVTDISTGQFSVIYSAALASGDTKKVFYNLMEDQNNADTGGITAKLWRDPSYGAMYTRALANDRLGGAAGVYDVTHNYLIIFGDKG